MSRHNYRNDVSFALLSGKVMMVLYSTLYFAKLASFDTHPAHPYIDDWNDLNEGTDTVPLIFLRGNRSRSCQSPKSAFNPHDVWRQKVTVIHIACPIGRYHQHDSTFPFRRFDSPKRDQRA